MEQNEGSLVKPTLEWVSLRLRDDNLGLCFTGEVVVMFSRALLVDGALLDEASKFPIVANDDPIDGNKVLLPSSLSLCLLLTDRALVEEATRFLAERPTGKSSIPNGSMGEGSFSSTFSLSNGEVCSLGFLGESRMRVFQKMFASLCVCYLARMWLWKAQRNNLRLPRLLS